MSAAKEKKVPGIVKFLIFVAIVALFYFFGWPFVKGWLDKRSYETANTNAQDIYNLATSYATYHRAPKNVSAEKITSFNGSKDSADSVQKYINVTVDAGLDGTYYSLKVDAEGKVVEVFWSKTNDGSDIIGSYPTPMDPDNPKYLSLKTCVDIEEST